MTMTLVEKSRRIALLFQLKVQFVFQFSIIVCVARILIATPVALWRRENFVHESIRSNQEWHKGDAHQLIASPRQSLSCYGRVRAKISGAILFFVFPRTRALLFLVKKIFGDDENKVSNKVHFFLVDFESYF
jgi:hypothetical protein